MSTESNESLESVPPSLLLLKAFVTVTIIGPLAMMVMSGIMFGGFAPIMGIGHPVVLVVGGCLYCTLTALWKPCSNRFIKIGVFVGLLFLSWVIFGKLTCSHTNSKIAGLSEGARTLRDILSYHVVFGAWIVNLILLFPQKWKPKRSGLRS